MGMNKIKFIIRLTVMFFLLLPIVSFAETHTVKLKITNPNSDNSCQNNWCQVYVEIPAKLYMDKGWLRSDLKNLRFNDGVHDLNFWNLNNELNYILHQYNYYDNKLGIWLLVYNLYANSTHYINMIMDDTSTENYCNPGASTNKDTIAALDNCASSVFPFYARNLNDGKFAKNPSGSSWKNPNTKFINKRQYTPYTLLPFKDNNNAKTGNKFTLSVNKFKFYAPPVTKDGRHYNNSEIKIYFLSQAPSQNAGALDTSNGYQIYFKKAADFNSVSDDLHYNMYHFEIYLRKKEGSGWVDVAKTDWYPYNNSRHVIDLKVGENKIALNIDWKTLSLTALGSGSVDSDGKYIRNDSFTTGFFGFDRKEWVLKEGEGDFNYIILRKYFENDPIAEIYGSSDLVVGLGSADTGENKIEINPDIQHIEVNDISGNTLDKYIFSTYYGARENQTAQNLYIKIKNRYSSTQTFNVNQKITALNNNDWMVYWCDDAGNNCSINPPNNVTITGNSSKTYNLKVIPSPSILFNGGNIRIKVGIHNPEDASFDNAAFSVDVKPKLGCYWKYKMPITISYYEAHGFPHLRDYQVLVELNNVSELQYAKANGSDIIVTDGNGSIVKFWIKEFDRASGKLKLWVKLPYIPDGDSTFYVWWDNSDYYNSLSNINSTFDLWEDWETDYSLDDVVGCPDGTDDCAGVPNDPNGWKSNPYGDLNWWKIHELPSGNQILQADEGSTFKGDGSMLSNGSLAWDHYEVSYKTNAGPYTQYHNSNNTWGNPQFNPIFLNDMANFWWMEHYDDKYIFRPKASGIDYTWIYQTNALNIMGSSYPERNKWYWVKVRIFHDKETDENYLRIKVSDNMNTDYDKDDDFKTLGSFIAPPSFALSSGKIGFGGVYGGFYFDDIRVRKYLEDSTGNEPSCENGTPEEQTIREKMSLSQPQISPPYFNGRASYVYTETKPFSWLGDVKFLYADCYISGACKSGENKEEEGTVSVFGSLDSKTPKGLGYFLMKAYPSTLNRDSINDTSWQSNGRFILTYFDNDTLHDFNGFDYFDLSNCDFLNGFMHTVSSDCSHGISDTAKLIKFIRGYYVSDFTKSEGRNMDAILGDNDSHPEIDEQWKLGDILHSNPIIIGIPNMYYTYASYQEFVTNHRDRDLVTYFMTNDGMLHSFKLASYENKRYRPLNKPIELWAYIPQAVLGRLKDLTNPTHTYITDGLIRAIDVYDSDNEEWKTVLLGLLGKGGESIFAIDITNPEQPKFLWEINKYTNASVINNIGTTISSPALGKLGNDWVAVFGSGYSENFIENFTSKNAYLTVIDILTGSVDKQIKVSDKVGNVLTNITSKRNVKTGNIDTIYFGDYYGVLWRIDNDTLNDFDDGDTLTEDEMLFKPVDYESTALPTNVKRPITAQPVIAKGSSSNEWWVYFGTGDYDEYDASIDYQRFYGLKDKPVTVTYSPYVDNVTCDNTSQTCGSFSNMTNSANINNTYNNWLIEFGHNDSKDVKYDNSTDNGTISTKNNNERLVQPPAVFAGFVFFTTFQPYNTPCGGGTSRFYALNFNTGMLEEQLFSAKAIGDGVGYKDIRSLELKDSGVSSKPMIYMGPGGKRSVTTTASINSSTGSLETIVLNPAKFIKNLDILLWRKIK